MQFLFEADGLRRLFRKAMLPLLAVALGGCVTQSVPRRADLVIADARIVPLGEARGGMFHIVVTDKRISRLVPATGPVPSAKRRYDAAGAYVIPGLWDMHVHAIDEPWRRWNFDLLLANGVTAIRDMNGATSLEEAADLKRAIAQGRILGPDFFYPGPVVDGAGRREVPDNVREVRDADEARDAVADLTGRGADFIKPYNRLNRAQYDALAAEARARNIRLEGHVPLALSPSQAIAAGQRSLEHLGNMIEATSPDWAELQRLTEEGLRLSALGERPPAEDIERTLELRGRMSGFDAAGIRAIARLARESGAAFTPTLVSNRATLLGRIDPDYPALAELAYVPAETRAGWEAADFRRSYGNDDDGYFRQRFRSLTQIVRILHNEGATLLAGTDSPTPYVVPGFALHRELALLVDAGLTPREAIEAATIGAARFAGAERDSGTIAVGKKADLVVLASNPAQDISALASISAVVRAGRLLDRAQLDALLAEARGLAERE